ncbi:hypothetical protein Tco_0601900 [Tanacetum coccineum]
MWDDLILAHKGSSDTRDTKIVALRLKFNTFKALAGEKVNGTFTRLKCFLNDLENNGRANNSIKIDSLAILYGKYNYEEGLIDQIYELEIQRFTIHASSSKALIFNNQFQDSDSDVKEDLRSSSEFITDLNIEYHERALLENQKRFYNRSGRVGSARKTIDKSKETCFTCGKQGKYKGLKSEIVVLTKKIDALSKGKSEKGLVAKSFDWDEESLSSKDEGTTKVKAFMAIAEEEPTVGKADVRSGQSIKTTMKKVDGNERKYVLDYTHVDFHYVEDQKKNLVN